MCGTIKKLSTIYQYLGEYDDNIFPTKLKTLINFYYLIFFRIVIANMLVITFLIIKKIEINNIILKIIRPPLCKFLFEIKLFVFVFDFLFTFYYAFYVLSTKKFRQISTCVILVMHGIQQHYSYKHVVQIQHIKEKTV